MKKNGFTLVELLAIILLLTVLIVLVITNVSAPLDNFNGAINSSRIDVVLSAAKNYAEDNINSFAQCVYNKTLSNPGICIINIDNLINEGYLDISDTVDVDDEHSIVACYNSDNATILTFYKDNDNVDCSDIKSHRMQIEPDIAAVYYQDDINITSKISTTETFDSIQCEVSPDNIARSNWATCSVSSDKKTLNVHYFALNDFPYISEQNLTIRIIGYYKNENNELKKLTKNFRLVIYK